ncbi:MAG: phage tail protein [Bradyrhizobium sp.]|uniref:phage tail protein n=1 Tax=Bradyrhizobium sp. TaxID=376 RepID=UPI0029A329F3|nr:phage tail protein [Bradyrhizobium sp.]MDX3966034.1 phage tail protein [Bradyrhizobium sp.]
MGLEVKLDASKLESWASQLSARGMRNAIRRAVDKSASAARKVALDIIAKDAGVSVARIKPGVTKLRRTTQTDLSASFTATKLRIGILETKGASVGAGGLRASTHRLTGGGSASLNIANAFVVRMANGARFVAFRKSKSRLPIKGVYAEMPSTAMGQDRAAARVAWQKEAEKQLAQRLPQEVQKQLLSEGLPYSPPADTGE